MMNIMDLSFVAATLVDNIADGRILEKMSPDTVNNPTATPPLIFTRDVFYLMGNISSLVNAKWYMGKVDFQVKHVEFTDTI
jgi:hypothetical protein